MDVQVEVEGLSLEEALQKAATALGIEKRDVEFQYDRAHLAAGAATVKIIAKRRDPNAPQPEIRAPASAPQRRDRDRDPPRGRDRGRPGDRDRRPPDRRGPRGDFRDDGGPRKPKKDPERDEQLRQKALALAERVLAGEGPQSIDDLNSYERHIVHTAIRDKGGGLTSKSVGEGLKKQIWIALGEMTP